MKTLKIMMLAAIAVILASACTEKIDLKIKNAPPSLVIEGFVDDGPGPYYVLVSKSKLFTDNNNFEGVGGATMVIGDDLGNTDTLTEVVAGLYLSNTIHGNVGHTYYLHATVEGTTYQSQSTMPPPVDIDSVLLSSETEFNGDIHNEANIEVQDPAGVRNFYRITCTKNSSPSSGFNVHRDRLWDGKLRTFSVPNDHFDSGDTLQINLKSIDEAAFIYFNQLNQNQDNFGAPAAPANPDPVFVPAALGYFSAHSVKSRTVIIP